MSKTRKEIEEALKALGIWDTGEDYVTVVKDFQRLNSLKVDGIVGPLTLGELFPPPIPDRQLGADKEVTTPVLGQWPRQSGVASFYGPVGTNQTSIILPWAMQIAWGNRAPVIRFSLHKKVHDSAMRVFKKIATHYNEEARKKLGLNQFGGCLNVRKMRGGNSWSMHSWGIAIDFDPERNQLKWGRDKARLASAECNKFWDCWEEEGWISLGRERNYDWMHVQAARL